LTKLFADFLRHARITCRMQGE